MTAGAPMDRRACTRGRRSPKNGTLSRVFRALELTFSIKLFIALARSLTLAFGSHSRQRFLQGG